MSEPAANAFDYQLLVKRILLNPVVDDPEQEIVYRDRRLTYRDFRGRVARLANALARLGVEPGDTVAVMDWDSHRYLEAFFAVPMMGALLRHPAPPPREGAGDLQPLRAEVAVIGAPDDKWGERPLALVVARPEHRDRLAERDLALHAHGFVDKGMITRQAVLLKVKLVDAIDKTSLGKINKVALRQKHLG